MSTIQTVKQFTHTDLDGVGCYIIADRIFPEVVPTFCNYDTIDTSVIEFMDTYGNGGVKCDLILITDISVKKKTADLIDEFIKNTGIRVMLIDHHRNLEWLNDNYSWVTIIPKELKVVRDTLTDNSVGDVSIKERSTSGTSLLYDMLGDPGDEYLKQFAEYVRKYDTWEWEADVNECGESPTDSLKYSKLPIARLPKKLNDLLFSMGRDKFIKRFRKNISTILTDHEEEFLEIIEERNNSYIKSKLIDMEVVKVGEHNVARVFAESNISLLGNTICKENPNTDYALIIDINKKTASLRTVKDDIDLSVIAKYNGGGGHPKSAGFGINVDVTESYNVMNQEQDPAEPIPKSIVNIYLES